MNQHIMQHRFLTFVVVFLCSSSFLFAQKFSNEFLSIGVGARAQAMGDAQVANVGDASAGFWNPAGLVHIKESTQVSFMHAEWFGGIGKYDYLSAVMPLGDSKNRVFGLSIIRLGIDNIPNTLSLYDTDGTIRYENITSFSAADYGIFMHYAQTLNDKISLGGNVKIVHRTIGPFAKSWGFGLDAGLQYRPGKHWQFGVLARDISTTFNAWSFDFTPDEQQVLTTTGNVIPESSVEITKPQLILGAAYTTEIKKIGFLAELNLITTTDGQRNVLLSANPVSIDAALGIELDYLDMIYLRSGLNGFQKVQDLVDVNATYWTMQPNVGLGLDFGRLLNRTGKAQPPTVRLDYAYSDISRVNGEQYNHVISLTVGINWRSMNQSTTRGE